MTDPDLDALLWAVFAAPDDDTPRLVLADWLDDRGLRGDAERAEFVRVQCELAGYDGCRCNGHCDPRLCRQCRLRRREMELWAPPLSRDMIRVAQMAGLATLILPGMANPDAATYKAWGVVRRGFVDEVCCPLAVWVGGECRRCEGRGHVARAVYDDGTIGDDGCPVCSGAGRWRGIACAAVAAAPTLTRVVLTDREPTTEGFTGPNTWMMCASPDSSGWQGRPEVLPWDIFGAMRGFIAKTEPSRYFHSAKTYPTRQAVLDAMSEAALAIGRERQRQRKERVL